MPHPRPDRPEPPTANGFGVIPFGWIRVKLGAIIEHWDYYQGSDGSWRPCFDVGKNVNQVFIVIRKKGFNKVMRKR
jgi:hypothetical protein